MTKTNCVFYFFLAIVNLLSFQAAAEQPYPLTCFCTPQPPPQCSPGYNPIAYLKCTGSDCNECLAVSGRVDFLWWRAAEEGTSLGCEESFRSFTTRVQPSTRTRLYNDSRIKNLNSHYKPGFRLGLDYVCVCDGWDAAINWTHFHTSANASGFSKFEDGKMTFLLPAWERVKCLLPQRAKATWKLELDLVDLELGRKFYLSSCFIARPLIGIRAARIAQSYRTESFANDIGRGAGLSDVYFSKTDSSGCFLALGPRIGALLEYRLGCGIALFGEAATSILFGRFDRHANEQCSLYPSGTSFAADYDYHSSTGCDRQSRTITDMSIGINYSRCVEWCNRVRRVTLSFAWEHHVFYHLNSFNFASNSVELPDQQTQCSHGKSGNLYTQGLVVSADIGF